MEEAEKGQPEINQKEQTVADWLWQKHGLKLDQLNLTAAEEKHLLNLGIKGLKKLLAEREADLAEGKRRYRDELITPEERAGLLRQLKRLKQEGGGHWAEGEKSIGQDKPADWLIDEEKYLAKK